FACEWETATAGKELAPTPAFAVRRSGRGAGDNSNDAENGNYRAGCGRGANAAAGQGRDARPCQRCRCNDYWPAAAGITAVTFEKSPALTHEIQDASICSSVFHSQDR